MKRGCVLAACVLAAALALSACKADEVTQIVVVVDSDFDGFERVTIDVDGFTSEATVAASLDDDPLPRRVTLVHDGGPLGPLSVYVSGFVAGTRTPVLVEPRAGIFFQKGKALMLKVNLLFECIGKCDEACLPGPRCVSAEDATELTDWDPDFEPTEVRYMRDAGAMVRPDDGGFVPVGPDGGPPGDGGPREDGGPGDDAGPGGDAGPRDDGGSGSGGSAGEGGSGGNGGEGGDGSPDPLLPFTPSNFDPEVLRDVSLMSVTIDCAATFDSTALDFVDWCGAEPEVMVVEQSDNSELVLLAMSAFELEAASTLRLVGSRPVALVVLGDAEIAGTIDASGQGVESGGGALATCVNGASTGTNGGGDSDAAGGGSGGGFGTPGGLGGAGFSGSVHVSGGAVGGGAALTPLRGGCPGGSGGEGTDTGGAGGGGGGAFQLTVAGELLVSGQLLAVGGGGQLGVEAQDGGGGGGSGGAILLEAGSYTIDGAAVLVANGGSGAAGLPSALVGSPEPGVDGQLSTAASPGGVAAGSGGDGGDGAGGLSDATDGVDGTDVLTTGGAGGGGGGGVGRIRINGAADCVPAGVISPQPSVDCPDCSAQCPAAPAHGCRATIGDAHLYYVCHQAAAFDVARSSCGDVGMSLVRVDDQVENDWLAARGPSTLWIGASDAASDGDWRWVQDDVAFWSGTESGNAVGGAFEAWASGEPDSAGSAARFTSSSATWADAPSTDQHAYVCEALP